VPILWITLALTAYLLSAIAFVVDKYLLALPIPKPFPYAFWVAILSLPIFLIIPFFNIYIPGATYLLIAFTSGAAFFGALILLYTAVKKTDISVASTQVGVSTSIFTYILSLLILKEVLPLNNIIAITALVLGMLALGRAGRGILKYALFAGFLFGLSFVLLKWTFTASDFVNGFLWTRAGFIGAAFLSLLLPYARKEVRSSFKKAPRVSMAVFAGNKLLAGTGFLLLYYSILLGSVTIINALLGFQFLFIFLVAFALRNKLPGVKENIEKKVLRNKLIGITLVITGFLAILF